MKYFSWITQRFRRLPAEYKEQVLNDLNVSASPGFDFFIFVILSSLIATLGLITDSPAVIIGAMLVAPLMSPIIGIGMSSVTGDGRLLRNGASALVRGALLAVLLSSLLTLSNSYLPFVSLQELPKEVLARTHPSPIDLVIALAGGMAAAYAMSMPNLSAALPGVAIATALMPPLCTIGIGIALERWDVAGGAALLFITNAVTIAFAAALVFFLLGFNPSTKVKRGGVPPSLVISALLTVTLLIPLSIISVRFFQEAAENRLIHSVVATEVYRLNDSELVNLDIVRDGETIDMNITVRTNSAFTYEQVLALQAAIVKGLNRPVSLVLNQVFAERLDPLIPPTETPTPTFTMTYTSTSTVTPGPSPTVTSTITLAPTITTTSSATITPTYTASPTNTVTLTPTPEEAQIKLNYLPAMKLYQSPGGPVIGNVRSGQYLKILYRTAIYGGIVWVEVEDDEQRVGWIPQIYLYTITPEPPTHTPQPSETPVISPTPFEVTLTLTNVP